LKQLALNIFKFYIFFNIHVAFSVVALYLIFNAKAEKNYIAFIFFSTILAYNIIRLFNFKNNRFFIKRFFAKNKKIFLIALTACMVLSAVYYFKLPLSSQLWLIPFFILSFFYNLDFRYAPFLKLRNNGTVKIISVAVVWSGLSVLIPGIKNQPVNSTQIILRFIWVFLYVLMLTLSFDQRDLLIDELKTKTLPQKFKNKLHFIYLITSFILMVLSYFVFDQKELVLSLFIILLSAVLCYRSNTNKSFYYTAFWIEALPVLWLALLYWVK